MLTVSPHSASAERVATKTGGVVCRVDVASEAEADLAEAVIAHHYLGGESIRRDGAIRMPPR